MAVFILVTVICAALTGVMAKEDVIRGADSGPEGDSDEAQSDLITSLPGLNYSLPFQQYSGYLPGVGSRRLHYWLVESENNVAEDPLVIWFNGGPGCSSLAGLFEENGPFKVAEDARTLVSNPHRWNKIVSILYIESPVRTGFSYSADGKYYTNDIQARDSKYAAVLAFYKRFPRFAENDMYLFGQSYGGVYVPMLADVINNNTDINFKGFAVGNGFVDSKYTFDSLPFYEYTHGMFGESEWQKVTTKCCDHTDFRDPEDYLCDFMNCDDGYDFWNMMHYAFGGRAHPYDVNARCSIGTDSSWPHDDVPLSERALFMGYLCMNSSAVILYLNQQSVRQALHIPDDLPGISDWHMCGGTRGFYDYSWSGYTSAPYFHRVMDSGKKTMLYYGTTDIICNFLGGRWFARSLDRNLVSDERPWYYEDELGLRQVAGSVIHYDRLDYVSVKGGSHMVPKSSPRQAYEMLRRFLTNWPSTE